MKESIDIFINNMKKHIAENKKLPYMERNILAPPTSADLAMDCIIECFLKNWYVPYPASKEQVYTEALIEILYKYSKKFRKSLKQ